MENILILDTETTALDPEDGKLIEIGAIFYSVPHRSIISQCSVLLPAEDNPAYNINFIPSELLKEIPDPIIKSSLDLLIEMIREADHVVAHNASFDRKWIETVPELAEISKSKNWVCSKQDVVWPIRKGLPLNLIHLCAYLSVPITATHRAIDDANLLRLAIESLDDIEYFLTESGKGRLTYFAEISYSERHLAKDKGFQWDDVKRKWFNKLTQEEAKMIGFTVYPAERGYI